MTATESGRTEEGIQLYQGISMARRLRMDEVAVQTSLRAESIGKTTSMLLFTQGSTSLDSPFSSSIPLEILVLRQGTQGQV